MSTQAVAGASGTAVILGASGAVGKPLLTQLLSPTSPYNTVYSFARRPHPSPPTTSPNVQYKEVIVDFEKIHNDDPEETAKLTSVAKEGVDAVYITMGTTRAAAGSMAAFEKIDRGYVLASAKALLNPAREATLIYCSSGSSSSSSWFPYLKSKGLTEEGLANLYKNTIIMRPGFLQNAQRPQLRLLEKAFEPLMNLAGKVSDSAAAPVSDVAKAMIEAAKLGPQQLRAKGLGQEPSASFKLEAADKDRSGAAIVQNPSVLKLARDHA